MGQTGDSWFLSSETALNSKLGMIRIFGHISILNSRVMTLLDLPNKVITVKGSIKRLPYLVEQIDWCSGSQVWLDKNVRNQELFNSEMILDLQSNFTHKIESDILISIYLLLYIKFYLPHNLGLLFVYLSSSISVIIQVTGVCKHI